MRRCKHGDWTVVSATYDLPRQQVTKVKTDEYAPAQWEPLIQGRTRVAQRCGLCGWVDVTVHTGRVAIPAPGGGEDRDTLRRIEATLLDTSHDAVARAREALKLTQAALAAEPAPEDGA